MSNFKIGQLYDPAFSKLTTEEAEHNLQAIAYGLEERAYTKNLTEEEILEKKDQYSEVGLVLSQIAQDKKEFLERMKEKAKLPTRLSKELLEAIKYKSEQKYGKLFMVDDQENNMMYFFDEKGMCVDARLLDKKERQIKMKTVNS